MDLHTIETYLRPIDLKVVPAWNSNFAWLAGGTWLFSEAQPQIKTLVDLEALHWSDIEITEDANPSGSAAIAIGATCTFAQLQTYSWNPRWSAIEALKSAISALAASFKITNVATIGGNLCLALAVGVMAPVMVALDATYEIWHPSGSVRSIRAKDFQLGMQKTALQPGEVLRRIWIPIAHLTWRTDFQRFGIAATDPALAIVMSAVNPQTNQIRVVLGASLPSPHLLKFPAIPSDREVLQTLQAANLPWLEDYRASADYRQHVTEILLYRSLLALENLQQ